MTTPSTKVTAATVAAALTVVAVWAVQNWTTVEVPTALEGAITTLLTLLVGYLVPERNPAPSAVETIANKR